MLLLFRLPFALLEMALRQGLTTFGGLLRLLRGQGAEDLPVPPPAREPTRPAPRPRTTTNGVAPGPPPPSADEALRRRRDREATAPPPPPGPAEPPAPSLRSVPDAPPAHVDREAVVVESLGPAGDPHAALNVEAPWEDYDGMPAAAVVQRVRGADEATKAIVRLYEQTHKGRRTVLAATAG
jgi:hypothetical protein